MKPSLRLFVSALILLLTGCADTDELIYDNTLRNPTTRGDVYQIANPPTKPYKSIADITFLGPAQEELRAQKYFLKEAGRLGGNGIIVWKTTAQATGDGFGNSWHTEYKYLYHAKVIVYDP